ncbi:hypothetical protein [Streptomyces abikoensis]|uniref:hypothetical protein n=1 Tax=Streptomyces abikoensis TaxID=97398 RepID=UPI001673E9EE|nr:hypothetical protein [Streptomyces abikoensis]GGP76190.1 hypothetical protein GCM10010214_59550 [Streptomyces abikoensis]
MPTVPSFDAARDADTSPRPVPPSVTRQALLVPVTTVLGVLVAGYALMVEGHRMDQSVPCKAVRAPVALTEYVAAWAGLALGVTAVAACVLAAFTIRRRCATGLWATKPGLLAYVSVWLNIAAIPFELLVLLMAHRPAGVWGGGDCG